MLSLSTARWVAPSAFLFNFIAQIKGIVSDPNMADIHYDNLSFFSPAPQAIGIWFTGQMIAQLAWIYRLFKLNGTGSAVEKAEVNAILDYVPWYAFGNVCIGVWMFLWNANRLDLSFIPVILNTGAHLYYVFALLPPLDLNSTSSLLTHAVAQATCSIGVMDVLHNGSAAFFKDDMSPSILVRILTGVGFGAASLISPPILAAGLVYDLIGLAIGQSGSWRYQLAAIALGSAAIATARQRVSPMYVSKKPDYDAIAPSEDA